MKDYPLLRLPIYETDCNVLPGEVVPFLMTQAEDKKIITYCIKDGGVGMAHPFGVINRSEPRTTIGCTVQIQNVLNRFGGDRTDVVTFGMQVFEAQEFFTEEGLLWAQARLFPLPSTAQFELREHVIEAMCKLGDSQGREYAADELTKLDSFGFARLGKLSVAERQELLATFTEEARLTMLLKYFSFRKQVPDESGRDAINDNYTV